MKKQKQPGTRPGGKGGSILTGGVPGNKGGGRPKSIVREMSAQGYEAAIPGLRMLGALDKKINEKKYPHLKDASINERIRAAEVLGKYGGMQQLDLTTDDKPIDNLSGPERIARMREIVHGEPDSATDSKA